MTENLDDEHQPGEPPERTQELLHILDAVLARARHVIDDERHEPEAERDVEVGGRRRETRNQSDQVAHQDEDEEASEEGDVSLVAVADHTLGEAADGLDEDFGHVAARDAVLWIEGRIDDGELPAYREGEADEKGGHESRRDDLLGQPEGAEPGEGFVFHQLPRPRIASHTAATGKQVMPTAKPIGSGRCSLPEARSNHPSPRKARSLTDRNPIARRGLA